MPRPSSPQLRPVPSRGRSRAGTASAVARGHVLVVGQVPRLPATVQFANLDGCRADGAVPDRLAAPVGDADARAVLTGIQCELRWRVGTVANPDDIDRTCGPLAAF